MVGRRSDGQPRLGPFGQGYTNLHRSAPVRTTLERRARGVISDHRGAPFVSRRHGSPRFETHCFWTRIVGWTSSGYVVYESTKWNVMAGARGHHCPTSPLAPPNQIDPPPARRPPSMRWVGERTPSPRRIGKGGAPPVSRPPRE